MVIVSQVSVLVIFIFLKSGVDLEQLVAKKKWNQNALIFGDLWLPESNLTMPLYYIFFIMKSSEIKNARYMNTINSISVLRWSQGYSRTIIHSIENISYKETVKKFMWIKKSIGEFWRRISKKITLSIYFD